jgi:hypothetical protein
MASIRQDKPLKHADEEGRAQAPVARTLPSPVTITTDQGNVKWSAQSETDVERDFRLRREGIEIQSYLKREEAEARHKLDEEKNEAKARRRNQLIGLCAVLAMILLLFGSCVWIVFSKQYTADMEKWATVTLSLILTGSITTILGYAIGKAAAK